MQISRLMQNGSHRAVEEEFNMSNPFVSSFKHLWGYFLFALASGILVILFLERVMLVSRHVNNTTFTSIIHGVYVFDARI
jgi:hypothetical protein